jgi:hypothetical protein
MSENPEDIKQAQQNAKEAAETAKFQRETGIAHPDSRAQKATYNFNAAQFSESYKQATGHDVDPAVWDAVTNATKMYQVEAAKKQSPEEVAYASGESVPVKPTLQTKIDQENSVKMPLPESAPVSNPVVTSIEESMGLNLSAPQPVSKTAALTAERNAVQTSIEENYPIDGQSKPYVTPKPTIRKIRG